LQGCRLRVQCPPHGHHQAFSDGCPRSKGNPIATPLRILYIEDNSDDADLVTDYLRRAGYAPVIERVDTAAGMTAALAAKAWDLVLSDYSMPGFTAPEALQILHASGQDLPFIIVSGTIQE